jgi:hypothetical protein
MAEEFLEMVVRVDQAAVEILEMQEDQAMILHLVQLIVPPKEMMVVLVALLLNQEEAVAAVVVQAAPEIVVPKMQEAMAELD